MQKDLTRTGARGIGITFRVSQFQETACDKHSHPTREVKINVKTRFAILLKKEKNTPVELKPTNFELDVQQLIHCATLASRFASGAISAVIICTSEQH